MNSTLNSLKKLKFMSALLVVMMSSLFAASCSSSSDDSNKSYYTLYADNISATVIDNDQNVSTEAYFTALNQKLQQSSGLFDSDAATAKTQLTLAADKAIAEFEQTTMPNVYFYGRYGVSYSIAGTSSSKTELKTYSNKALSAANLTKALTKIAAANPDGFTVDATTLEPLTKGFAVSLEATQNSFGSEGLAKVIEYVTTHDGVNAYGGWLNSDNNQFYYDATVICSTRAEAEELAKTNHQIAFFDLENMEEIRVQE